jgi:hypothetical protein
MTKPVVGVITMTGRSRPRNELYPACLGLLARLCMSGGLAHSKVAKAFEVFFLPNGSSGTDDCKAQVEERL